MSARMWVPLVVAWLGLVAHAEKITEPTTIRVEWYSPNARHDISLVCFEVMRQDPSIICQEFAPLRVDGGMGYTSGKVMAFATGAGPEVFNLATDQIASFVEQGFLLPLNEFVGHDGIRADGTRKLRPDGTTDLNGQIDDDEALWEDWKRLDPLARKIVTVNGVVYSIPARRQDRLGLLYRRDLVREAGLSEQPPRDWDELFYRLQKLTQIAPASDGAPPTTRRGIYISKYYHYLYPWVWAAGGDFVSEGKINPDTGATHWFSKEELAFIDPQTGQSLATQPSQWRVTLTTEPMRDALRFMNRLFFQPWIIDPRTGEPMSLSDEQAGQGWALRADGSTVTFDLRDVQRGVARTYTASDQTWQYDLMMRGQIACIQGAVGSDDETAVLGLSPQQLGFWPVPPQRAGDPSVLFLSPHWLGMSPSLAGEAQRSKRLKAWKIASALGGELGQRMYVRYAVQQGRAGFMQPEHLKLAGFEEYISEIPEFWRRDYQRIFSEKTLRYEPFNANWLQVARNELAPIFDAATRVPAYDFDQALASAQDRANTYLMKSRPAHEMQSLRTIAWIVLLVVLLGLGASSMVILRSMRAKVASAGPGLAAGATIRAHRSGAVFRAWVPWLLLAPALLSIGLWAYYPLLRGAMMAFMDFRLMGQREWVGLDNFINVVLDDQFRASVWATLQFVAISLSLTFVAPIILALLLHEAPWGKTLYRTIFFLPQVCSGVVIMLFWKQVFDGSANGLLNVAVGSVAALLGLKFAAIDWLGHPLWAPICVVLPQLWASAGVASLIYLAAIKTIPDDLYEAADLDGAGLWRKLFTITLPMLAPLVVINFVGAFIGTFQQMQNIFVMTGGRGGTRVLALHIWYTAYADLQFGPATACAWIMGSALIGFTVMQMRLLSRVEFHQAKV